MQTSSNIIKRHHASLRGLVVLASAGALVPWLWRVSADAGHAAVSGAPLRPDEALTGVVASAALAAVGWLALGVLLELLSTVPGAVGWTAVRVADVVTPTLVRRAAGALLGVGLAAGIAPGASVAAPSAPAVPVHAVSDPLPDPGYGPLHDAGFDPLPDPGYGPLHDAGLDPLPGPGFDPLPGHVVAALPAPGWAPTRDGPTAAGPGWVPGPPVVREQPDVRVLSPAPRSGTPRDAPAEVVVRRGDTLWSIAARHLGPDASDAEIARVWPHWFEANRRVVGDDPDLLRPGQVLHAPEGVSS